MAEFFWTSLIANNAGNQVLVCPSFDGLNWMSSTDINQSSKFAPSLAALNGQLYVAFIANNSGNAVLVCSTVDGVSWTNNTDINQSSKSAPSLAAFNGKLYVGFIANNSGNAVLVCSSADGVSWTNNTDINQSSKSAPSLATFNNRLYVAFIANNASDEVLICSTTDGVHWTDNTVVNQASKLAPPLAAFAPSLAAFNGKLYVAFVASNVGNQVLVCSSADGVHWTSDTDINQSSNFAPSLAAFNGKLYVAFVASNAGSPVLVCSTADGVNWASSTDINQSSKFGPSLAVSPFAPLVKVPMFQQPGTQITITGSGFGTGTKVTFGAGSPVSPQSISPGGTSLVVTVPTAATSGPISVTGGGTVQSQSFAVDTYRNTRGFSFSNDDGFQSLVGGAFSYDDATALFGASQTTLLAYFGHHIEDPLVTLFRSIAGALLDSNGQCFGFALGSLRFITGEQSLSGLSQQPANTEPGGPQGPDVWMLNGPPLSNSPADNVSPRLASFIHQQHLAQFSQESIDQWVNFHASVNSAAGLRNAVQKAFSAGGRGSIGAVLALDPQPGEGHAVVAYEIVDIADSSGSFDILVYNPNVPFAPDEDSSSGALGANASNSVVHVMSDGSWTFPYFDWTGGIFNITVIPWNTIPVRPTVPWAEIVGGLLTALWLVTGDATVSQVSDGQGHTLLANGKWNVDPATLLPGVRPMPAIGGLGKLAVPAFVSNRLDALTHTITGHGTGAYGFDWLGGGCGMTLADVPATPGGNDSVVTSQGKISFIPASAKAVTATVIGRGSAAGALPRTATLKVTASALAAVALSFDPTADTFTYAHAGAPTSYTVEFSSFDTQGNAVTYTPPALAVRTGDMHIFAPNWADLASGAGTVTMGHSDGTTITEPLKPVL